LRDGYHWTMDFRRGVPTGELQRGEPTDRTGTIVTFWPDAEIFDTTDFSYEYLRARFQQMAFLNKGLKIRLIDERHAQ
ncbi:DNA topoisomerase IV subunit B, partial [Klebsiella pneumoniae]|nr:DNA topoisomerase IV subunit B [Klebsiella pneumoniae]